MSRLHSTGSGTEAPSCDPRRRVLCRARSPRPRLNAPTHNSPCHTQSHPGTKTGSIHPTPFRWNHSPSAPTIPAWTPSLQPPSPPIGATCSPKARLISPPDAFWPEISSCATSTTASPGLRPKPRRRPRRAVDRFHGTGRATTPRPSPTLRGPRTPRRNPSSDRGRARGRTDHRGNPRKRIAGATPLSPTRRSRPRLDQGRPILDRLPNQPTTHHHRRILRCRQYSRPHLAPPTTAPPTAN